MITPDPKPPEQWAESGRLYYDQTADLITEVDRQAARIEKLEKELELALSFCPEGPVIPGLFPMFYHTLEYETEVKLQARIDAAREALKP